MRQQVFLRNRSTTKTTQLVSVGGQSQQLVFRVIRLDRSANGRYVVISTAASNVPADQPSRPYHTLARDLAAGMATFVFLHNYANDDNGQVWPNESSVTPGVPYAVGSANSSGGFLSDNLAGILTGLDTAADGAPANRQSFRYGAAISANGRYVEFSSVADSLVPGRQGLCAPNICECIFSKGLSTGYIIDVTTGLPGKGGGNQVPAISADGNVTSFCAYSLSGADQRTALRDFREVHVANVPAGTTHLVSYDDAVGPIDGCTPHQIVLRSPKSPYSVNLEHVADLELINPVRNSEDLC